MAVGSSLGAFAEGFADSRNARKDREERQQNAALQNRMIDVMARQNEVMANRPVSYGAYPDMGGSTGFVSSSGGGSGNTSAEPAGDGTLLSLIDKTEGGGSYDTLFGHSQRDGPFAGTKVSQMTLGDLSKFSDPSGEYGQWVKGKVGRVATPLGRYQFVGTTLRNTAKEMGLPDDTVFNRGTQDAMFKHHAKKTLARAKTPEAKRSLMRGQWEGFKNVSDSELDSAIARFENGGRPIGARRPAV